MVNCARSWVSVALRAHAGRRPRAHRSRRGRYRAHRSFSAASSPLRARSNSVTVVSGPAAGLPGDRAGAARTGSSALMGGKGSSNSVDEVPIIRLETPFVAAGPSNRPTPPLTPRWPDLHNGVRCELHTRLSLRGAGAQRNGRVPRSPHLNRYFVPSVHSGPPRRGGNP